MKCKQCNLEMVRHAEGTFDEDGWICLNCLAIQKELNPRQTYKGIIVKSLRKAWYEKLANSNQNYLLLI